jgi:hypothetical protein
MSLSPSNLTNQPLPPDPAPDKMGDNLVFPSDLENYGFHIAFEFRKWQRRSIKERDFFAAQGSVRLPIPQNMVDNQQVQWGEQSNNPVMGTLIDAGAGKGNLSQGDVWSKFKGLLDAGLDPRNWGGMGAAGAAALAQRTFGQDTTGQGLALFGVAINPFLTVVFQSPMYKRHQFAWRLSPTNPDESEALVKILAKFKQHMLPSQTNWLGGTLLNYPDIMFVTLYPRDRCLYKFKRCVVEMAQVNYAPNSPAAFFDSTKAPQEVILTLNLLEIEYWTQEDVIATWDKDSVAGTFIPVNT